MAAPCPGCWANTRGAAATAVAAAPVARIVRLIGSITRHPPDCVLAARCGSTAKVLSGESFAPYGNCVKETNLWLLPDHPKFPEQPPLVFRILLKRPRELGRAGIIVRGLVHGFHQLHVSLALRRRAAGVLKLPAH